MNTITARLDDESIQGLTKMAEITRRSPAWLVAEAVRNYLKEEEWKIAAIEEGLRAADDDEFASTDEVKSAFAKWGVDAS